MSAAPSEISAEDLESAPLEAYANDTGSADHADSASSALQGALTLAEEYGIPVFPCRPDKRPYTKYGFQDAACNIEQIAEWWTRWPDALVGVPTGQASKLLVVDIDPPGAEWRREHAERLACGRVHRTRRGHHLLYRYPSDAEIRNSAGKVATGVDVRGEGGYIIWWPAHGLDAVDSLEDLTEPPKWLLELMTAKEQPKANGHDIAAHLIPNGKRNEFLSREAFRQRKQGASVEQIREVLATLNQTRCAQPLDDEEVRGIAERKGRIEPEAVPEPPRRAPMEWRSFEGRDPPKREWIIPHWIPGGCITLLAGRGGIGKTLIAQHIATALALGHEYIEPVQSRRVLMWAGEDDEAELWRRQHSISSWMGQPLSALTERLSLYSYVGCDITFAAPMYGSLKPTAMLGQLREQVRDHRAELVILDNVARIYGGSENDRHAVTTFLAWLAGACSPAAVLLLAHPAKAAGSEYSGSTAWEGAVRARLYLSDRPPDQDIDDDAAVDDRLRYLARRKANYSALDIRRMTLTDGVLIPDTAEPVRVGKPSAEYVQDIVSRAVTTLSARDIYGTASTASPNYLPHLAKQYHLLDTATDKAFAGAMREMILSGALISREVGRSPDRHKRYGLVVA